MGNSGDPIKFPGNLLKLFSNSGTFKIAGQCWIYVVYAYNNCPGQIWCSFPNSGEKYIERKH